MKHRLSSLALSGGQYATSSRSSMMQPAARGPELINTSGGMGAFSHSEEVMTPMKPKEIYKLAFSDLRLATNLIRRTRSKSIPQFKYNRRDAYFKDIDRTKRLFKLEKYNIWPIINMQFLKLTKPQFQMVFYSSADFENKDEYIHDLQLFYLRSKFNHAQQIHQEDADFQKYDIFYGYRLAHSNSKFA